MFISCVNLLLECGIRPLVKSSRIVGGTNATFGEWPWQVLIQDSNPNNFCGGVLISQKFIITTASCQLFPKENLSVMDDELNGKIFR